MDEGTGSTIKDDAASHTGTITGATWKSESDCISGNCLYFDGDDYVATPAFALSGTVLTVSGWVKTNSNAGYQTIIGDNGEGGSVEILWIGRWTNSDQLTLEYANYGSMDSWASISSFFTGYNNVWVHFAVVADYSGKTTKIYRNGLWLDTINMTGTPIFPSTNNVKYLGAYNTTLYRLTNGNLYDIRIYNRGLSDAEIKALYEGTK
jgi:hypothetical protein